MLPEGLRPADVHVSGGRIQAVLPRGGGPAGVPVLDAGGDVVMPGLVDTHAHLNEPGRTEWEGFETATRACAAGGITTVIDMPLNCVPVTTTRAALEAKRAAVAGQAWVDHGFWGGVVPGNAGELPGLVAAGALGCKAFLVHSGIDDFPAAGEADLRAAMPVLRELGAPLLVHAELELPGAPDPAARPRAYASYLASRPPSWEAAAVALIAGLVEETACAAHVVHLSAADALAAARRARQSGLPLSVETCPHYLTLAAEDIPDGRTEFKCAPPIRERANQERLWAALAGGDIDLVVSDHSPCAPALKLPAEGDFARAWGGIASLQLGLPLIWTAARARGVDLVRLGAWMCERPARLAGLSHRKGRIAPGLDADLVIWDPEAELVVEPGMLRHRHPVTPYLGRRLYGVVRRTLLRGREIWDGRDVVGPAGGEPLLGRG